MSLKIEVVSPSIFRLGANVCKSEDLFESMSLMYSLSQKDAFPAPPVAILVVDARASGFSFLLSCFSRRGYS